MANSNSGEAYVADANDNITKISQNIAAGGGLLVTDRATDQPAISGTTASIFLSGRNVYVQDTASGVLSAIATFDQ